MGLLAAAITSPIVDRTHSHLKAIKLLCPLVAFSYLGMVWAPQTRTLVAPYVIAAVMGASSFSLLPIALEYLVEVTFPASPELPSTLCWVAGQLFGGIFIVIMNALKEGKVSEEELRRVSEKGRGMSEGERPAGNMFKALVFLAVVGLAVLPAVLALGMQSMGLAHGKGRLRVDEHVGSEASEGEGERSDGATGDEGRGV